MKLCHSDLKAYSTYEAPVPSGDLLNLPLTKIVIKRSQRRSFPWQLASWLTLINVFRQNGPSHIYETEILQIKYLIKGPLSDPPKLFTWLKGHIMTAPDIELSSFVKCNIFTRIAFTDCFHRHLDYRFQIFWNIKFDN